MQFCKIIIQIYWTVAQMFSIYDLYLKRKKTKKQKQKGFYAFAIIEVLLCNLGSFMCPFAMGKILSINRVREKMIYLLFK